MRAAGDRNAAVGAALWLMTLGPAAEPALEALDDMAGGKLDDYARGQARAASTYIRQALLITRDGEVPPQGGPRARQQIARLLRAAAEPVPFGGARGTLTSELIGLLEHPDAYVRAGAAEGLALLMLTSDEVATAIPTLERMLADEDFAELGIAGEFKCEGRVFHWRRERRSPRAHAIQALFAVGRIPNSDRMLKAMLAEATLRKSSAGNPQHRSV